MDNNTTKAPLHPLVAIAIFCAAASLGIVGITIPLAHPLQAISGSGLWAIAAMAACPSLMGIAIAFFMTRRPLQ